MINDLFLRQAVNKLNANSAPGPDKIRHQDIKHNFDRLRPILIHLFRRILETGKIAQDMKLTDLKPSM